MNLNVIINSKSKVTKYLFFLFAYSLPREESRSGCPTEITRGSWDKKEWATPCGKRMKRKRNIRTKPNSVIKSVVVQSVYSMPTLSRDSLEWQITRESSATRKKMETCLRKVSGVKDEALRMGNWLRKITHYVEMRNRKRNREREKRSKNPSIKRPWRFVEKIKKQDIKKQKHFHWSDSYFCVICMLLRKYLNYNRHILVANTSTAWNALKKEKSRRETTWLS